MQGNSDFEILACNGNMKYVTVPTQACLLSYLLTFTTRLLIFVYYVYPLVLLTQYCEILG